MADLNYRNQVTKEVFFDILTDLIREHPADPMAFVRQWMDVSDGTDPAGPLARQLRKDANVYFHPDKDQCLTLTLMQAGLRHVDWKQIAEHLIFLAEPDKTPAPFEDDGDDEAATA